MCFIERNKASFPMHQIGIGVLYIFTSLTKCIIPLSFIKIPEYMFYGCKSLSEINLQPSIRSFAFNGCSSLSSIEIPDNVYFIGQSSSANCTSLILSIHDFLKF